MTPIAVIFDMDGVVVDSHDAHFAAWEEVLIHEGHKVGDHTLDFIFDGRRRDEIMTHFFGRLPPEESRRIGRLKEQLFWNRRSLLRLTPGFLAFLGELETCGVPRAVATSASRERAMRTLDHFDLVSRFGTVVTGDDVTAGKPDPALFLAAAERLSVDPARSIVFEDAVAGIQAAKAAGMACIAILSRPELKTRLQDERPDEMRTDFRYLTLRSVRQVFDRYSTMERTHL